MNDPSNVFFQFLSVRRVEDTIAEQRRDSTAMGFGTGGYLLDTAGIQIFVAQGKHVWVS